MQQLWPTISLALASDAVASQSGGQSQSTTSWKECHFQFGSFTCTSNANHNKYANLKHFVSWCGSVLISINQNFHPQTWSHTPWELTWVQLKYPKDVSILRQNCSSNGQKVTTQHSHPLQAVIGQLCGSEKARQVWTSLSSFLLLILHTTIPIPFCVFKQVQHYNAFPKRLKVWKCSLLSPHLNACDSPLSMTALFPHLHVSPFENPNLTLICLYCCVWLTCFVRTFRFETWNQWHRLCLLKYWYIFS